MLVLVFGISAIINISISVDIDISSHNINIDININSDEEKGCRLDSYPFVLRGAGVI